MAGKLHESIAAVIFIIMAAGIGALTTMCLQPKPITTIINEQFAVPYIDEELLRMRWRDI